MKNGRINLVARVMIINHNHGNQFEVENSNFWVSTELAPTVKPERILPSAKKVVPDTLIETVDVRVYQ